MKIKNLIGKIKWVDAGLTRQANKAVNLSLTIRNWLIGFYIVEFEQDGETRAKYGDKLLQTLADQLKETGIKGMSYRNLNIFREFYLAFPHILHTLSAESHSIVQTLSAELEDASDDILQLPNTDQNSVEKSQQKNEEYKILTSKMLESLSFSHIILLLPISDKLKQSFYIIEAIKGTWSVRELKRQINSLLYERSGLSQKPEQLLKKIKSGKANQQGLIKDIYTFEFLGLPQKDAVEESDLETALLDHLREFILELGNGFCLETRQKRILIGDEYFFIDLVFYHRILKCHVLIELKINVFNHENASQLNTYLNYYKKEVQEESDNDPVGILLVTGKNKPLVEYATAGMDKNLFVSKYLLQLPSIEKLRAFLQQELKTL